MAASFNWDFTEESKAPRPREEMPPPDRTRRLWLRVLVVAILIGAALSMRAWIAERLRVAEQREAELRAVVDLELKTITEADMELFRSLQDPVDPTWQERQIIRFVAPESDRFTPAPGLVRSNRSTVIDEIHFFGRTARVELTRWFEAQRQKQMESSDWPAEALPFQVTWFYRFDEDGNWYHVAPPDDYWGIPYSWHGSRLSIRATEIEAERIDATARQLAIIVSQACLLMDCREDAGYLLSFEDIPAAKVRGDVWALPALYLTGIPANEAAHTAWQRNLKFWALEMLARAQLENEDDSERLIFLQLLSRLQSELISPDTSTEDAHVFDVDVLVTALRAKDQHPVWSLWQVRADSTDARQTRLLEAEVAALLAYIEEQVQGNRLFELLPALGKHNRLGDAISELYDLDLVAFSSGWVRYLEQLTGVSSMAQLYRPVPAVKDGPVAPPPTPIPPSSPPGNHIALNCGGRVWVGNADGSNLLPVSARGQRFADLLWSPNGRWLATSWQFQGAQSLGLLYIIAADGSGGRLLTDDPAVQAWPIRWSPDGREIIYYAIREDAGYSPTVEIRAFDVESGQEKVLPGVPEWSPDGQYLVYVTVSADWPMGSAWLADSAWQNPRRITEKAWAWPAVSWTPDSSRVALAAADESTGGAAVVVFDLVSEDFLSAISVSELNQAILASPDALITDGDDYDGLVDRPLSWLGLWGWSSQGRYLGAAALAGESILNTSSSTLVAAIPEKALAGSPFDGAEDTAIEFVAFGKSRVFDAEWSPLDTDRLTLSLLSSNGRAYEPQTFLIDLKAGAVLTETVSGSASWSPDGQWVAFGKQGSVVVTDAGGEQHFQLETTDGACDYVAWNPMADLSDLRK